MVSSGERIPDDVAGANENLALSNRAPIYREHESFREISTPIFGQPGSKFDRLMNTGTIPLSRAELLCAGTVFLAALVLYSRTLAPTVTLTDSGELIVVAYGLGIAHPPGVPLWVLLAHLASLVPLGNVAARINFSSALFAALASAMFTLVVAELMITTSYLAASKRRKKGAQRSKRVVRYATSRARDEDSGVGRLLVLAPALGAGLLMAFSRTLWSYATITEVYS